VAAPAIDRGFAETSLAALTKRGFQKARVRLTTSDQHELQAEFGHPSLLRTTHNTELSLLGIVDDKQGSLTLNNASRDGLADAVDNLWAVASGSRADPANDIATAQPKRVFNAGPPEPDLDKMYERVAEALDHAKTHYPTLKMGSTAVTYSSRRSLFLNSNGVDFDTTRHVYHASLMFTARDGTDVSSFNYTGATLANLDRPLASIATADALMRQTTEQVRTRKVPSKFTGDLIITPDCLDTFFGFLIGNVGNQPMIAGTSLYKESLGKQVADPTLTLHSRPRDLVGGYFVTGDGFEAQNATVVDRGVLKSFMLDQYGSRKTGLARAVTGGGAWVVEPGSTSLADMIRDVRAGLVITRFSGGRPNDKGDFSGIAKNSYYVENGAIAYPISETMVSGNMAQLLTDIVAVSKETADFGSGVFPWVRVRGIGIS
jgi:PmbA protein